jgi:hypothetical protein
VQWLPGVLSPEGEADCRCNPSEYWDIPTGVTQTTVSGIAATAHKVDPYTTIKELNDEVAGLKAELRVVKGRLVNCLGPIAPIPEVSDPVKALKEFIGSLESCI